MFFSFIVYVAKFTNHNCMVEKKKHFMRGEIGIRHKNKFTATVPLFDHIRQKATCGSLINYGLIQILS